MPRRPNTFAKTRQDHASETAEDYVEAIDEILQVQPTCRVKDLSTKMQVSHVTVIRILRRLASEGLIEKEPYGPCSLTKAGISMARRSRRRHQLLVDFLVHIGVPAADAARDAEGMEHHVSDATLAAMRSMLRSC